MTTERPCAWCHGPIDPATRRDKFTCSQSCRQAKSRFRVGAAGPAEGQSIRFAYSDPPYPGMAKKYYGTEEVDHQALIDHMVERHPGGWALSTSAEALQDVLAMCPAGVRVASWVRGPRAGKAWRPRSAWEPLIVYRGRPRLLGVREYSCDVLMWHGRQSSHPGALVGMKSAAFAEWMFEQLGALKGDGLVDLFPGSGVIQRAWDDFQFGTRARARRDSCYAGAERRLQDLLVDARHVDPRGTTDTCRNDS